MARPPLSSESEPTGQRGLSRELGRFAHDRDDPVELWKERALARVLTAAGLPARPRIELASGRGFVLTAMLAGVPFGPGGPVFVLLALSTLLLVPELVRAAVLLACGRSALVVVSAGFVRIETIGVRLSPARAALFAVLGPATNLVIGFSLWLATLGHSGATQAALRTLALWHGGWGLVQALPLAPFAAGVALQARLRQPYAAVHQVVSTKLVVMGSLVLARFFPAALPVALVAVSGALRGFIRTYRLACDEREGLLENARRAEFLVASSQPTEAWRLARRTLARARDEGLRMRARKCLAWSAIGKGDAFTAHAMLGMLPPCELDVHLVASYLAVCARTDEALALLERARTAGHSSRETTKLCLDLLLGRGDVMRARVIAGADAALLSAEELAIVEQAFAPPADSAAMA